MKMVFKKKMLQLALISFSLGTLADAQAAERFSAMISAFGGGGQMVLNGFPVLECDAGPISRTTVWNPYLRQGDNELLIFLTNQPVNGARMEMELSTGAGENPKRLAVIAVKSKPEGGFVTMVDATRGITNATIISRLSLTNGFDLKSAFWQPGSDVSVTFSAGKFIIKSRFFIADFPVKKLPWESSPTTLAAGDPEALHKYATELIENFRAKDVDRCVDGYAIRNHHLAESMGLPSTAVDEMQRKIFLNLKNDNDAHLFVAKSEDIVPRMGGGWKVARLKCDPLFKWEGTNAAFIGEHFYAKVGGKWVCVD